MNFRSANFRSSEFTQIERLRTVVLSSVASRVDTLVLTHGPFHGCITFEPARVGYRLYGLVWLATFVWKVQNQRLFIASNPLCTYSFFVLHMYMYLLIYVTYRLHIYIFLYRYIHIICMYIYICMYVCIYRYVCMYICIHIHLITFVCNIYIYMYTFIFI